MARIETYPFDLAPTVNDYVIGTDGDNLNATRNYKVMTFLDYLGTQYNLNSTDMLFEYDDVISTAVGNGYVSTNNYADGTILMSGVTNIYVSKLTGFGQLVEDALNSIGTNTLSIMFADMGNRNNYGIFDVVSAADVDANTINLTVTATTTLGSLSAGKVMGIRLGIGGGAGNFVTLDTAQTITGTKTFQSALATQNEYKNDNGRITAIGQGTTFNIQIGAGSGFDLRVNGDGAASFYIDTTGVVTLANLAGVGDRMVVADASGNLSTQAISGADNLGNHIATQNLAMGENAIEDAHGYQFMQNSLATYGSLAYGIVHSDTYGFYFRDGAQPFTLLGQGLTAVRTQTIQDKNGTLAHLDDIPSVIQATASSDVGNALNTVSELLTLTVPANSMVDGDMITFQARFTVTASISDDQIGIIIDGGAIQGITNAGGSTATSIFMDGHIIRNGAGVTLSFTLSYSGGTVSTTYTNTGYTFTADIDFSIAAGDSTMAADTVILKSGYMKLN